MGEFFNGWRRKAGLVTLAMACALTVGWVQSYVVANEFGFIVNQRQHTMLSIDGRLAWHSYIPVLRHYQEDKIIHFMTRSFDKSEPEFDELLFSIRPASVLPRWLAPYWSFVLPLTLLSAWLILGKKPKAKGVP